MMAKYKLLKLGLYNAGSLGTGHDDFQIAMARFEADIVAINETWIRQGEEARAPRVPGYRFRHSPRPADVRGGRGGGVGFYIRNGVKLRKLNPPCFAIEQMWFSTLVNSRRLAIGTAYRPPWLNIDTFLDALTESVTCFSKYDHIILMGDFNVNMLDINSSMTKKLLQFLQYLNLVQYVDEPTHFTNDSQTLIDLVCANVDIRDVTTSNISGPNSHSMINVTLNLKKSKIKPKTIT